MGYQNYSIALRPPFHLFSPSRIVTVCAGLLRNCLFRLPFIDARERRLLRYALTSFEVAIRAESFAPPSTPKLEPNITPPLAPAATTKPIMLETFNGSRRRVRTR